jgi:hypothetical protein
MKVCEMSGRNRMGRIILAFWGCWWVMAAQPTVAATYMVTTVADSGAGSLRQAMLNADANEGLDKIVFNLPFIGPFDGPFAIVPLSALPMITDPVIIDGTTQPGYAGTPLIEINGSLLPANTDGLLITDGGSTVRGLAINRCPRDAIRIESLGTNIIQGNFLGTDTTGTEPLANGNGGVTINGSPGNLIGGTTAAERNVISGGNQDGIYLISSGATGNVISGNYIGTSVTGQAGLGNVYNGLEISDASSNVIGGTVAGAGNVIAGNGESGVYLLTLGATGNLIEGNLIGLNASGTAAIGNMDDGVTIYGVGGNTVGGTGAGARNTIAGNGGAGVYILTNGASSNIVMGNYIGTDITGKLAIPNQGNGVVIDGVPGNTIGGTNAGARNVISGNVENGVLIIYGGASSNLVQGNFIGVDASGSKALPNTYDGITVDGAANNLIGGSNGGNVISGNDGNGVLLIDSGGGTNYVQGNLIGTDYTGKKDVANGEGGIYIQVPGNTIGGLTAALRNVISGNEQSGVFLYGANTSNNWIEGNYIGVDITGEAGLGNGYAGITLSNAPGNIIGGASAGAGNVISSNGGSGIILGGSQTTATVVQGNYIGTDASGNNALGNAGGGIYFYGSGTNTIGGAVAGAGNLISGNFHEGVSVGNPGANFNTIQGNLIGTKLDGISPLGNEWHNIDCLDTASNNLIGGTDPGADNRIAFVQTSLYDGVRIRAGCTGNFVSRNCIFSNAGWGIVIGPAGLNTNNLATLTQVAGDSVTTSIKGKLSSYANGPFLIQFYENVAPDPSGYGEGLNFIGATNITTGANGQASFALTLPVGVPPGSFVSATATDGTKTTWEFDADVEVQVLPPPAPGLSLSRIAGSHGGPGMISIAWPTNSAGFFLQQTTNLNRPVIWTAATNAVTVLGTTNSVTITPSGKAIFYRLLFGTNP